MIVKNVQRSRPPIYRNIRTESKVGRHYIIQGIQGIAFLCARECLGPPFLMPRGPLTNFLLLSQGLLVYSPARNRGFTYVSRSLGEQKPNLPIRLFFHGEEWRE